MNKQPLTGQIQFVSFLRNIARLGHCWGGRCDSCRSAIIRFTMYDKAGGGGGGGGCGGGDGGG